MNDCKKIGCNLCNPEGDEPSDQNCAGKSHPEISDIKNRELALFFLSVLILIIIGIAVGVIYEKYFSYTPVEREIPVVVIPNAGD